MRQNKSWGNLSLALKQCWQCTSHLWTPHLRSNIYWISQPQRWHSQQFSVYLLLTESRIWSFCYYLFAVNPWPLQTSSELRKSGVMQVCNSHLDSLVSHMFQMSIKFSQPLHHPWNFSCHIKHTPPEAVPGRSPFLPPDPFSMIHVFEASQAVTSCCQFVQIILGYDRCGHTYVNTPKTMMVCVFSLMNALMHHHKTDTIC